MKHFLTTNSTKILRQILPAILLFCFISINALAVQMNYQGVVKQYGVEFQGPGYFKFTLGDVANTTNYWANDGTDAGQPATNVSVNVVNGFFHFSLGDGMTDIPADLFSANADVYLRVWFAEQTEGPYDALGSSQRILPVPYAVTAGMLDGYTFHTLTNSVDIDDDDANPANELNTSVALDGSTLKVTDPGGVKSADLSSLIDDADHDTANELNSSVALNGSSLEVTDAGGTKSANLSSLINDADYNPSNELNSSVALNGSSLEVTDAGGTKSADLSTLIPASDWEKDGNNIYNANAGNVGIGTTNVTEKLEVVGNVLARNVANTSAIVISPSPVGTNLVITGSDNDGSSSHPLNITDEDGYEIVDVRSSLSPGAQFGANASQASFGGTVKANTLMVGKVSKIAEGADYCLIGGGLSNQIENSYSDFSGIASGYGNIIGPNNSSPYSFIGGGRTNVVDNDYSVIGGGRLNYSSRLYCFIGGGRENIIKDDSSVICGGKYHLINEYGEYSFIGGGYRNLIRSYNPSDRYNTIVGGFINSISNSYDAFIGGGSWNNISYGPFSTIGGGQRNISFEKGTTIAGGRANRIVGEYCMIGGGWSNKVDGYSYYSTIPGGLQNRIYASNYGFAAGRYARIWHNGCFAWADSNPSTVDTTAENQFIARASGGFVFLTAANGTTTGAQLPAGSGSWSSLSDKNSKENIIKINGRDVLDKIGAMEISTWNYKAQDDAIRHAGPMAQDFHAAFGLGEDNCHLSSVDVDGIALAAIKELKAQKDAEISEMQKTIKLLIKRIEELENEK